MNAMAELWFDAWNARDADAIMDLYAEDVEFHSPFVARLGLADDGCLKGKAALDGYIRSALSKVRNLQFDPIAVCEGMDDHTLVYRNQSGHVVTERHEHNGKGLIRLASAAYSTSPLKRT